MECKVFVKTGGLPLTQQKWPVYRKGLQTQYNTVKFRK